MQSEKKTFFENLEKKIALHALQQGIWVPFIGHRPVVSSPVFVGKKTSQIRL
jgi:hypothetical protein